MLGPSSREWTTTGSFSRRAGLIQCATKSGNSSGMLLATFSASPRADMPTWPCSPTARK